MIGNAKFLTAALLSATVLAGCTDKDSRPVFDGVAFRTKASVVDKKVSRAVFDAVVFDVAASPLGAREALRYAGTTYCIEQYGTSKIDWQVDLEDPEAPLPRDGDNAVLRGTCNP
ncbi:hypothetical protein [Phaeobacter sp. 11ANDIMAR09]|uniref:hypothetical protein n=1 Tax=Phaeobacter sp. 11ANDIMAR09 TaxID=1225647 RepID=UPI0006D6C868|nr:hypothetical protein [Phaeobacter sp. 11ANDIMAR09]KPD12550.1 hypothetical protein AN476_10080 [Phaeobacter sp. 11ANDIMAR09]OIQ34550.1 MAG: hypothetical protein BM559_05985 [Roseobacter sp. MedPE-SWchi]